MGVSTGGLPLKWDHGSRRRRDCDDPPIQIHRYDARTVVMRQSKAVSYEAPFLYLFLGDDRALLLDTGATEDAATFPLRATIDQLLAEWLVDHPRAEYPLVVAHTHGHGDHVAGDGQLRNRPNTTVVAKDLDSVRAFWGFTTSGWPEQVVSYDLGGRILEVTGSPGHHATAISIFDPHTGFLLTGDSVYPGRLYAFDPEMFAASLDRLVAFADERPVTHVMGCHIEMTTRPGVDYPLGSTYQPSEPPLQMTVEQLRSVRDAAVALAGRRGIHRYDDYVIVNGVGLPTAARLSLRGLRSRVFGR